MNDLLALAKIGTLKTYSLRVSLTVNQFVKNRLVFFFTLRNFNLNHTCLLFLKYATWLQIAASMKLNKFGR